MNKWSYSETLQQYSGKYSSKHNEELVNFLAKRSINRIFHFTHINNLISILNHGLLSRDFMTNKQQSFTFTDNQRLDELQDAICCSLSIANYYMLNRKVEQMGNHFRVLEFGYTALLFKKFACFPSNAARSDLKKLAKENPSNFVGAAGLSGMFLNRAVRAEYDVPRSVPTDIQAELMFFEPIPLASLRKIHIPVGASQETLNIVAKIENKYDELEIEYNCTENHFTREVGSSQFYKRQWNIDWRNL